MKAGAARKLISSRIPTAEAEFTLCLYRGARDNKDHLALVLGEVAGGADVLVRIHSECFTGDVLGSRRCDCGEQLTRATQLIAQAGSGVLVYLRQEGRGIGLLDKLRAYNLQDRGHDTVDANRLLGHQADGREYDVAAAILRDLGVSSIRLLTNNPAKLESLARLGIPDCTRVPLYTPVREENAYYLATKARRMRHLLSFAPAADEGQPPDSGRVDPASPLAVWPAACANGRPAVTLTYAQSLDGSITLRRGQAMTLSGPESLVLTHSLRARHDAILVGVGTVLSDDPSLTVRLTAGSDPRPVILDSHLRTPLGARVLQSASPPPLIATTDAASASRQQALEAAGASVLRLPADDRGQVDLRALLPRLRELDIATLMVEGGARVITSFLAAELVDRLVLTIAPLFVGGLNAVGNLTERNGLGFPTLRNLRHQWLGNDLILLGELEHAHD